MIALYAADKLAHEEAVQNGGVSQSILVSYFLPSASFFFFSLTAADPLLVWRSRPYHRDESRHLHLAIPQTRHRGQLKALPYSGYEAGEGVV
jgi:hypothetical protein